MSSNPFSGVECPFFWPIGLALAMEKETLHIADKNLRFFQEVIKTDIVPPIPEWTTSNKIVYDLNTFTLRDFSTHDASDEVPTLILPPYAGHTSVIADFHENQSLIATLLQNSVTQLFALEWRSAILSMKDYDIDHYLAELHVAITDIGGRVNLVGLCQGGWMAALYAARFPARVASLVCAGAPLDTSAGAGTIRELSKDLPMSFYEALVTAGGGILKGQFMLEGFKNMHPEESKVGKYIELYKHIDDPEFVKRDEVFESWYENTLDLPGRWYLQVIKELFKENQFIHGQFMALGVQIKPQTITCPLYLLAGATDEITPVEQVFNATNYFGTPKDCVIKELALGGHIGLFMGHGALETSWPKIASWLLKQK